MSTTQDQTEPQGSAANCETRQEDTMIADNILYVRRYGLASVHSECRVGVRKPGNGLKCVLGLRTDSPQPSHMESCPSELHQTIAISSANNGGAADSTAGTVVFLHPSTSHSVVLCHQSIGGANEIWCFDHLEGVSRRIDSLYLQWAYPPRGSLPARKVRFKSSVARAFLPLLF